MRSFAPAAALSGLHLGEFLPPLLAAGTHLALYGKRMLTLAPAAVAAWRAVSFGVGALLLVGVQVGPADSLADELLAAHMLQHIVIGDFCSLLSCSA